MNKRALTLSLGSSKPNDGAPDRFLTGRLLSFQELLKELREAVAAIRLPEQCKPALRLLDGLVGALIGEVQEATDELALLSSPDDRARRARDLHDSLEHFVHF